MIRAIGGLTNLLLALLLSRVAVSQPPLQPPVTPACVSSPFGWRHAVGPHAPAGAVSNPMGREKWVSCYRLHGVYSNEAMTAWGGFATVRSRVPRLGKRAFASTPRCPRAAGLPGASRDASEAQAGSLRLTHDSSRNYALAAVCAASNTSRADVLPATCSVPSTPRSIHPAFTASNISSAGPVRPCGMPNCSNADAHPARGTERLSRRGSGFHPIAPRLHPG